jgi:Ni/Fe-hydrogenase subunit HybB-like protein
MKSMTFGNEVFDRMINAGPRGGQRRLFVLFSLMVLAGAAAFIEGIWGEQAKRAWQAYLVNYLFWSGLCFGTLLFSPVLVMTSARWGRSLKRLAEAPGAFLPAAFALFWVLYFGRNEIFPWIHEPVPEKAAWLNAGFLFARDGVGILALTVVGLGIMYHSIQADRKFMAAKQGIGAPEMAETDAKHVHAQSVLSPLYGVLYAFILSLVAFDLVMSLDPHWYSTLFGAYFFTGSFYAGLAVIMLLAVLSLKTMNMQEFIRNSQLHDLGKLLLGFCLVTGDFFFAQLLVIWYGNLPEETSYIILRVRQAPWQTLSWVVLIAAFAIPFVVLLNRRIKMKPLPMVLLSIMILTAMWLERFLLVAPSLWKGPHLPLGWRELLITLGFFGLTSLCILGFLRIFPVLPVSDPLFHESLQKAED